MVLSIIDTIEEWFKPVKDFIIAHGNSWWFWTAIIGIALLIFGIVYAALNKKNRE